MKKALKDYVRKDKELQLQGQNESWTIGKLDKKFAKLRKRIVKELLKRKGSQISLYLYLKEFLKDILPREFLKDVPDLNMDPHLTKYHWTLLALF